MSDKDITPSIMAVAVPRTRSIGVRRIGPDIGVGRYNRLPVCRRSMTPAMMAVVTPAPGPNPRGRPTGVTMVRPSITTPRIG